MVLSAPYSAPLPPTLISPAAMLPVSSPLPSLPQHTLPLQPQPAHCPANQLISKTGYGPWGKPAPGHDPSCTLSATFPLPTSLLPLSHPAPCHPAPCAPSTHHPPILPPASSDPPHSFPLRAHNLLATALHSPLLTTYLGKSFYQGCSKLVYI